MKTIYLTRDDFATELHPFMFDQLLEELGLDPDTEMMTIVVASATSDVAE